MWRVKQGFLLQTVLAGTSQFSCFFTHMCLMHTVKFLVWNGCIISFVRIRMPATVLIVKRHGSWRIQWIMSFQCHSIEYRAKQCTERTCSKKKKNGVKTAKCSNAKALIFQPWVRQHRHAFKKDTADCIESTVHDKGRMLPGMVLADYSSGNEGEKHTMHLDDSEQP